MTEFLLQFGRLFPAVFGFDNLVGIANEVLH